MFSCRCSSTRSSASRCRLSSIAVSAASSASSRRAASRSAKTPPGAFARATWLRSAAPSNRSRRSTARVAAAKAANAPDDPARSAGVLFALLVEAGSAPAATSISTILGSPRTAAWCRAVRPCLSRASTHASSTLSAWLRFSSFSTPSSSRTQPRALLAQAQCNAVIPSLSAWLRSMFCAIASSSRSERPAVAAKWASVRSLPASRPASLFVRLLGGMAVLLALVLVYGR